MRTSTLLWIAVAVACTNLGGSLMAQEITVSGSARGEVDVHIAEEGDTLWDICDRFFDDPWYWPILWSFNPHITNPNWIFPGDVVYLVPPKPKPVKREGYEVSEAQIGGKRQTEKVLGRTVGFVSREGFKGDGVIRYSPSEHHWLAQFDPIYIEFKTPRKIRPGDKLTIYRPEGAVEHPETGEELGYKVCYLGVAKVLSMDTRQARAVITRSFKEVERGDRVGAYAPTSRVVPPLRNSSAVRGMIVTSFQESNMMGEYDYVVVDKGSDDGVQPGNRFVVRTRGDGLVEVDEEDLDEFPAEVIGEIMVVSTSRHTSLGTVTYARRRLGVGMKCEMLQGY